MIPLFKVAMNENIDQSLLEIIHSGMITQGKKVEEFEEKSKQLIDYITNVPAKRLSNKRIGLEYSMFDCIKNVDIVDKLFIRWHDRTKNAYVDL